MLRTLFLSTLLLALFSFSPFATPLLAQDGSDDPLSEKIERYLRDIEKDLREVEENLPRHLHRILGELPPELGRSPQVRKLRHRLEETQKARNEKRAIGFMRTLFSAQQQFRTLRKDGRNYGSFRQLAKEDLLWKKNLKLNGPLTAYRDGYRFDMKLTRVDPSQKRYRSTFSVVAKPVTSSSGNRKYFVDQGGTITYTGLKSTPNKKSTPIDPGLYRRLDKKANLLPGPKPRLPFNPPNLDRELRKASRQMERQVGQLMTEMEKNLRNLPTEIRNMPLVKEFLNARTKAREVAAQKLLYDIYRAQTMYRQLRKDGGNYGTAKSLIRARLLSSDFKLKSSTTAVRKGYAFRIKVQRRNQKTGKKADFEVVARPLYTNPTGKSFRLHSSGKIEVMGKNRKK